MCGKSKFVKFFFDNLPFDPTKKSFPLILILAKNFVFSILISNFEGYFLKIWYVSIELFEFRIFTISNLFRKSIFPKFKFIILYYCKLSLHGNAFYVKI